MRFAGSCNIEVYTDGVEINDLRVIGEHPHAPDDLDSYTLSLENDDEILKLSYGLYHIFFCGQYEWQAIEHWEYGTEYEIEITEWNITVFILDKEENDENN